MSASKGVLLADACYTERLTGETGKKNIMFGYDFFIGSSNVAR